MKRFLILAVVFALAASSAFAALTVSNGVTLNVVAVASIDIDLAAGITLNLLPPVLGGDPPTGETNNSKNLWYTVVTATSGKITVNWGATDAAPAGTSLTVKATTVTLGTATLLPVTITSLAQDFITAIPSGFTTRAAGAGPELNYAFSVDTPALLAAGATKSVTVTYTISSN